MDEVWPLYVCSFTIKRGGEGQGFFLQGNKYRFQPLGLLVWESQCRNKAATEYIKLIDSSEPDKGVSVRGVTTAIEPAAFPPSEEGGGVRRADIASPDSTKCRVSSSGSGMATRT
eukprot:Protomagalhaensia_sp_Gyna_25__4331@NODE_395_length_3580_cov_27_883931_g304_i0_p3_GENE_NODE_395_length_3580_cov_27_883931_g304_i0NODE_395_length_3580_cov_27_883931_g304_i0_p3_ORF_typecomplete_len115_score12_32_NODE_395_length_3580_cov_27_883931_g304_i027463090